MACAPAGGEVGERDVCGAEGGERGEECGCGAGFEGAEEVIDSVEDEAEAGEDDDDRKVVHALFRPPPTDQLAK